MFWARQSKKSGSGGESIGVNGDTQACAASWAGSHKSRGSKTGMARGHASIHGIQGRTEQGKKARQARGLRREGEYMVGILFPKLGLLLLSLLFKSVKIAPPEIMEGSE